LGHSKEIAALMYATYQGVLTGGLPPDDVQGITFLYPAETGTIAGVVSSSSASAPIAGATVAIDGSELSAATDGSGNYTLTAPAGLSSLNVTASASGYEALTKSVNSLVPDSTVNKPFLLDLAGGTGSGGEEPQPCIPKGQSGKCH
jgi:hypothetical protein